MSAIELCGERLLLDHRRALFWPRRAALFIADTHFGKSAIFRREGIAVPEGSDADDLCQLNALVRDHLASDVYILGDFVHGALPPGHDFYDRFNDWRRQLPCEVHVILGNHDTYLKRQALPGVHWHTQWQLEPFQLIHNPQAAGGDYFLCGHIHPVVKLHSRADSLRVPVFWQRPDGLVLPSFGSMTGGHAIKPGERDILHIIGTERVSPLPHRQAR